MRRLHCPSLDWSSLRQVVAQVPPLPPVIRYYDDFDDTLRSIRDPAAASRFEIHANGSVINLDFSSVHEVFGELLKHVFLRMVGDGAAPRTAAQYILGAKHLEQEDVAELLGARPTGISALWTILLAKELPPDGYSCAKSVLKLLCKHRINDWSDAYHELVSALPLPFSDKYAAVRSGEAFISANDEAAVVRFLDDATYKCRRSLLPLKELQDAAMLLCAYQFAMRPIQVAMLTFRDLKVRLDADELLATVHVTFRMAKQRSAGASKPLLRRVKREWTPLFVEIDRHFRVSGDDVDARVFGAVSANEASRRISSLLRNLLGQDVTAVNLRHTAAQRLVDAGASQEELAEFLGHTDITTALVYYETSANQAERVNKALGISDIYQRVARIAHDRFIDAEELAQLKESQQIGGAPHGVPIAGIGGCSSDQVACPYNPILSCYRCRKFMPIYDSQIHARVLEDFRSVVRFFHDSSRGEGASAAYLQLERTIVAVQAVLSELEGSPS
nr:site-specific integrase [Stenotrophomonas geniculata]